VIRLTKKPIPPLPNPEEAIRNALYNPIGHEPLSKLVGPGSKVAIGFDDPIGFVPEQKKPGFKELAIRVLLEELRRLGVRRRDIRLICAIGLHRKWTTRELATIVGTELAYKLGPRLLCNHDAEDRENLVYLGETGRGQEVEVNRAVVEADQFIYVSNPWCHFNGGWKSIVVGLSSWRSIRHHHRPFPLAAGKSTLDPKRSSFFKLLNEMGEVIDKELEQEGKRVFQIEGVMNNASPAELVQVVAGHPLEIHEKTLDVLQRQIVEDVRGQSDVVIYGLNNKRDPYSKLSFINPILVRNLGLSYSFGLFQNVPLVRRDGILILVHPCPEQFDELHYPSYVEMWRELIPRTQDPVELWELYAEDYAHRPEFVHMYRYRYAFHGAHPLILWGQGIYALKYVSRVFLAGATDFEVARKLGFEPFPTVEDAVKEAEETLGRDCTITYVDMPQNSFICNVKPE